MPFTMPTSIPLPLRMLFPLDAYSVVVLFTNLSSCLLTIPLGSPLGDSQYPSLTLQSLRSGT
jgi:hypothetical protein